MHWINLKNFQLQPLRYALTTPYPWRYFTAGTYATCIVFIVVLTIVNVHAVGYQPTTVPSNYQPPQSSVWNSHRSSCDPHQILQGDTFRTNISIFDYVVNYVNATDGVGSNLNGLPYKADPLSAACDENDGNHRTIKLTVDALRLIVIGSVEFNCTFNPTTIMAVTASNTLSYSSSDDTPFGPPLVQTYARRVLQVLGIDLLQLLIEQQGQWLSASAFINCPGGHDQAALEECHNSPAQLVITGASFSYSNGSTATFQDPSLDNYFKALSAASLADTGIWHKNSIFVSTNIVNETLQPGQNADTLRADPSAFTLTPTPAIILMTYTCHYPLRKPLLGFIISVLVADLSIFGTFWTIWNFVAESLASRSKTNSDHDVEIGSAGFDSAGSYVRIQ